jgi:hypothetical protein
LSPKLKNRQECVIVISFRRFFAFSFYLSHVNLADFSSFCSMSQSAVNASNCD